MNNTDVDTRVGIPCVVGPTASGKSDLAFELANTMLSQGARGVHLLSVDSKQVFRGLEILTGADIPTDWKQTTSKQFENDCFVSPDKQLFLHGVSIRDVSQSWSLAHFSHLCQNVMENAIAARHPVILVGGTGLYYQRTFEYDQLHTGPNKVVREKAAEMSVIELQRWLLGLDPETPLKNNHSDWHNPRRLVRAIERTSASSVDTGMEIGDFFSHFSTEYIGVRSDLRIIKKRIKQRVEKRLQQGVVQEVKTCMQNHKTLSEQAQATLGFSQIREYIEGALSLEACCEQWALSEYQYAKRQLTWWRKHEVDWKTL